MPTRFSWKSARLEVAFNSEEHRTVSGHRREPSGTLNWSFFIGLKQRQSRGKKPNPGFGKPPPTLALAGCLSHHTSCHLIQRSSMWNFQHLFPGHSHSDERRIRTARNAKLPSQTVSYHPIYFRPPRASERSRKNSVAPGPSHVTGKAC